MATTPPSKPVPATTTTSTFTPGAQVVTTTYLSFVAPITHQSTQVLLSACADLVRQQIKSVYLLFATIGGQVNEGVAIYTALRAFPFDLTTHNIGSVNSIGNIIFLAGQPRYAVQAATFLFHGVGFEGTGTQRLEEKFLREKLESIEADHKRLAALIASRTVITQQAAEQLFAQQATKDAAYAKANNIIDDIRDAQVPQGAPYFHLNVQ